MDALLLSRWQFAITTSFHFLFAPLSIGLALAVAVLETRYAIWKQEIDLKMTKFWGNLLIVNIGMGVVTGLVLEFQFGTNWSEFSRYVGDIFGPPLAFEAWSAFFLESVFIGVWIYGWKKLSPGWHAFCMWMVAIGAILSALWIISANAFMQEPVGYTMRNGRVELTDFFAFMQSPQVWYMFTHALFACYATGAFFIIAISAYRLKKESLETEGFRRSLHLATVIGFVSILGVIFVGHEMGRHLNTAQPMKLAAFEALWETGDPAGESLFAVIDEEKRVNNFELRVPGLLSFLVYNRFTGPVRGMNDLEKEYIAQYGPDDYIPPVSLTYWSFRIMVGAGMAMLGLLLLIIWGMYQKKFQFPRSFLTILMFALPLPYIANTTGWIVTEVGRQPWVVYHLMKTRDAVTPSLSTGYAWSSLILFTLVYTLLSFVAVSVILKLCRAEVIPARTKDQEGYKT